MPGRSRGGALGLVLLLVALGIVFVLYGSDLRRLLMPPPGSAAVRGPGPAATGVDAGATGSAPPAPTNAVERARSLGATVDQQTRESMRKAGVE